MSRIPRLFIDDLHGYRALSISKTMAWMMIMTKCIMEGKKVPTFKQVRLASIIHRSTATDIDIDTYGFITKIKVKNEQ